MDNNSTNKQHKNHCRRTLKLQRLDRREMFAANALAPPPVSPAAPAEVATENQGPVHISDDSYTKSSENEEKNIRLAERLSKKRAAGKVGHKDLGDAKVFFTNPVKLQSNAKSRVIALATTVTAALTDKSLFTDGKQIKNFYISTKEKITVERYEKSPNKGDVLKYVKAIDTKGASNRIEIAPTGRKGLVKITVPMEDGNGHKLKIGIWVRVGKPELKDLLAVSFKDNTTKTSATAPRTSQADYPEIERTSTFDSQLQPSDTKAAESNPRDLEESQDSTDRGDRASFSSVGQNSYHSDYQKSADRLFGELGMQENFETDLSGGSRFF